VRKRKPGKSKSVRKKRPIGRRPLVADPKVRERFLEAIRNGCTNDVAAIAVGIDRSTFYIWQTRLEDKSPKKVYVDFFDEVNRARAEGEASLAQLIADAGVHDWRAAAALLERRYPQRWGRRLEQEGLSAVVGVQIYLPELEEYAGQLVGGDGRLKDDEGDGDS
jgi:hypothetical protein